MSALPAAQQWQLALPCGSHTSPPDYFHTVMSTLLHSPNVTSSLLFRAEILYDSEKDHTAAWDASSGFQSDFVRHMKSELRPRALKIGSEESFDLCLHDLCTESSINESTQWRWQRTVVRNLVPRNPQRDSPLVQSCWYLEADNAREEKHLVIYVPHADSSEQVPFFHPNVQGLAMLYSWKRTESLHQKSMDKPQQEAEEANNLLRANGSLHVFYNHFPSSEISNRLIRTALNLQTTIIKHMAGRAAGYVKRVHHDRVIPQKAFQDTYTRLKLKYAQDLVKGWAEQTDPAKHVFEDLGIAAFLIELWKDMYNSAEEKFPGFVDVGCGNGLLVYLLRNEGYEGWGFDVRRRKTWHALPSDVVGPYLKEMACVPRLLLDSFDLTEGDDPFSNQALDIHDGLFPTGTFIISNHADELTAWTPLLACLSKCPFVAIPCCSHDFGGNKFRAKIKTLNDKTLNGDIDEKTPSTQAKAVKNVAETGSLKRPNIKPPSAYSTLCTWLEYVTTECGFVPEKEILRIPSTRNVAVLGRSSNLDKQDCASSALTAERTVKALIEKEMSSKLSTIATDWIARTQKIAKGSAKAV